MSTDLHEVITAKINAALEAENAGQWTFPWHRTGGGLPVNAATAKPYRGINVLALWVAAAAQGYADQRWATYRQWAGIGAQVRRGEKGAMIVFFKELVGPPEDDDAPLHRRFVAKASTVFNASQVEGAPSLPSVHASFNPVVAADAIIAGSGVPLEHAGDRACYLPGRDLVRLPPPGLFLSSEAYYGTAFHELTHSNRPQEPA